MITGNGLTLGKYRQLEAVKLSLGQPFYESRRVDDLFSSDLLTGGVK